MSAGKGELRQEGGRRQEGEGRAICAPGTAICILCLSGAMCRQENVWSDTTHSSVNDVFAALQPCILDDFAGWKDSEL